MKTGVWEQVAERFFEIPVSFDDFADFEQRMMRPTYADHRIDDAKLAEVNAAFMPHIKADGAQFTRPMHVRVLRKLATAGARTRRSRSSRTRESPIWHHASGFLPYGARQ